MTRLNASIVAFFISAFCSLASVGNAASTPLYYQDPDGKPAYAAEPAKTADGRDYKPVFEDASASPVPAATPSAPRKLLYYRNPMGLPDTSPVPKKDSMGMDYLPVYADESGGDDPPGTVRISPGKIQTLGVRTAIVEMRPAASRTVRATGIVQFDERHLATITTKSAGWIEHLAVAASGDQVSRGQVVAELYAPDLVAAEEEYLVASRMGGHAMGASTHGDDSSLPAAALQRLRALDVPEDEIARLRRTGTVSRRIAIRAVRDGVVIDKPVQEGMRVAPGDTLYKTADLSTVWLLADVQERDLGMIETGQKADVNCVAFPGRTFSGVVDFIYPTLAAETRSARVRIVMPNTDRALRAAMYASVAIAVSAGNGPILAAPDSAVIDSGKRQLVLVAKGEGRFEPRPVRIGAHGDGWLEILDGVKAGEQVVTGANFLIDAESNIRAALQGFSGAADNPTGGSQGMKP
jgi:membrane fusion protein, copper/silver efflux system